MSERETGAVTDTPRADDTSIVTPPAATADGGAAAGEHAAADRGSAPRARAASDRPHCSVIVPSYASQGTIRSCLTALLEQDAPFAYEVIVVDSSQDETPAIVRREFPDVQLIHLAERAGPETARNRGAEQARGEILAFIDSDCMAQPDWLRRLVARVEEGYDAIGGATANGNGETLVSWAGYICEFREFLPGGPVRPMGYLSPNTVAYPRDVFWSAGGFPRGYYPMEDQIFHRPLRERGARIALDPEIVVAHMHRSERAQFFQHQRRLGLANVRVLRVLGGRGAALARSPLLATLLMPVLVPFRFLRMIVPSLGLEHALVARRPQLAWLCFLGMCWWARGFVEGTRLPSDTIEDETWQRTSPTSS